MTVTNATSTTNISAAWAERADQLVEWTLNHLVNRVDAWGGYLPVAFRADKEKTVTKPPVEDRGKKHLTPQVIKRHFIGASESDVIGLHPITTDNRSRWFQIDVDAHDEKADPQRNLEAVLYWMAKLVAMGFDPLLTDSNGAGGYHLLVILSEAIPTARVYGFVQAIVSDFANFGFARAPETFPKQSSIEPDGYGNWARLPGRHHTRPHWSRVYDQHTGNWLEGHDAIESVLAHFGDDAVLVPEPKPAPPRPTKPPRSPRRQGDHRTDRDIALECLDHIPNLDHDDYDGWLNIGMALHSAGCDVGDWIAWSQQSPKYVTGECERKWAGFRHGKSRSVTIATLITLARKYGHEPYPKGMNRNGRAREPRSSPENDAPDETTDAADNCDETDYGNEISDYGIPDEAQGDLLDRATELANAEELHRLYGHRLRYDADRGTFMVDHGSCWKQDVDGQVHRWAKEIARTSIDRLHERVEKRELARFQKVVESARGINGVLKLLQTEPGVTVTSAAFDQDDYLLAVANGTLDLRTGNLRPHDPRDMITHALSTPYDPAAACPLWESVVDRSMGGKPDLVGYIQRWAGLFLTGSPNTHELLIAYGSGANGKSVIFDTLIGLLESLAGVAPESLLVARHGQSEHPTEIADLLGKRLVVASETESGATLRLQLIKRLTGDATIKARFMRQDFFEFRRTHKLVLITNNRPRLTENTEAVARRLRLLPFDVVIPPEERDPNLLDKLKLERPGILAWCVRGCLDQLRQGMNPPAEVLVATEEFRNEADELADFIAARCIMGSVDAFRVSRADLHEAYATWAKLLHERHSLDRADLYESIRRRDGVEEAKWKVDGQTVRGFRGIALASSSGSRGEEGGR